MRSMPMKSKTSRTVPMAQSSMVTSSPVVRSQTRALRRSHQVEVTLGVVDDFECYGGEDVDLEQVTQASQEDSMHSSMVSR